METNNVSGAQISLAEPAIPIIRQTAMSVEKELIWLMENVKAALSSAQTAIFQGIVQCAMNVKRGMH